MDHNFMKNYYMEMYTDPITEAVKEDEEYHAAAQTCDRLERDLQVILEESHPEAAHLFETFTNETAHMEARLCLAAYLLGAADREKMLR